MSQDTTAEHDLVTTAAAAAAASAARQIGRCGATTGPSAEDWEAKRAVITDLYKKMKLTELDIFMRREHNFHASCPRGPFHNPIVVRLRPTDVSLRLSKRMYNQRFKQWGCTKYIKFSEKEDLLKECGGSVRELTARYRAGKIMKPQYEKTLRYIRSKQAVEPPTPYIMEMKTPDNSTDLILRTLRDYHHALADPASKMHIPSDDRALNLNSSKESDDLWFGILVGVKTLLRSTGDSPKAPSSNHISATWDLNQTFAMLRRVGFLTAPAMLERPLDFVYEVLIEMTALQGKNWPELRHAILRLFNQEASRIFGPSHPVAVICREMLQDTDQSGVTFKSLGCIRDLVVQLWSPDHTMSFKAQMAVQKALLKVRDLGPAIQIGTQLFVSSRQKWGDTSQQARMAAQRLGQLYTVMNEMAMAKGEPDWAAVESALGWYNDVIRLSPMAPGRDARRTGFIEDETTLSTMGDMTYINNRIGKDAEALAWYQKAAEMSRRICNPGSTIMRACISMLINKQKEMKRFDQAAAWDAILSQMEATSSNESVNS
ncbi:hypothetical protein PFICI_06151 [Pestalotiopsis fici W106-1]|uniref:Clr5 domain-containing protein n=1 Tax=Pestalotiopsis fici (strain W106-1 / CGMCC3.15140) TaxID=1229662 RepID=W3X558_PESFW|nr:uncharacterized protein PFICI_06151 [Pestalotiopsis fici W106-1]ETS81149.1 hypothetical protein PFICI_06151 [Pestalotiopsis fici W106-1]